MAAKLAVIPALAALLAACGGIKDEVDLVFPDEASHKATTAIAVTAFEPFLYPADQPLPQFIQCKDVGVFPPTRIVDPETISQVPNIGRPLTMPRTPQPFPFQDWSLTLSNPKPDERNNPWGAVLVYLEARGEVRSPTRGGGQITATLLSGCYCVRTKDGSHPDHGLDQTVKSACPPIAQNAGKPREVALQPVIDPVFTLGPCGVQDLVSPKKELISPGPAVCLNVPLCDNTMGGPGGTGLGTGVGGTQCFRCQQPCNELDDKRNVPVLFTVDQPGGATDPKSQIVLTDVMGQAAGQITVDDCTVPIKVSAQVVGRTGSPTPFTVTCVPPVSQFTCDEEEVLSPGREPISMTTIPGGRGQPDVIAILYDTGMHASVEVRNPVLGGQPLATLDFPGETARQLKGYMYQLGMRPQDASRPVLAVATSMMIQGRETLELRFYEWKNQALVPHVPGGRPFVHDCPQWQCTDSSGAPEAMPVDFLKGPCNNPTPACGPRLANCTGNQTECSCPSSSFLPCGCRLMLEFQTDVTLDVGDLDGDQRNDLAVATSSDLPVVFFYSSKTSSVGLYREDGCKCGKYAQAPTTFELVQFGTPGAMPHPPLTDLVIGAPGGAFVKYADLAPDGSQELQCGQPERFGKLVPVRDLARGHYKCNPYVGSGPCDGLEDVVLVAAKSLGGGNFEDPGTIRAIFGVPADLSLDQTLFDKAGSTVELVPQPLPMKEDPRDPRTARVGDFNNDGFDDLAVLFGAAEEVHVWLGSGNKGLGEIALGISLAQCEKAGPATQMAKCSPLRFFTLADFQGTGRPEIVVICDPTATPRLRRYSPTIP